MRYSRVLKDKLDDDDESVDMTDEFDVYNKGKTVECECGLGIGTDLDDAIVTCNSCGRELVDMEFNLREGQAKKRIEKNAERAKVEQNGQEQTELADW